MKKNTLGRARPPATPCSSTALVAAAPEPVAPAKPVTHGLEGKMYLVREPIMQMLPQVKQDKPIIYQGFKNPVATESLKGLGGKTLGARKRFNYGEGFKPKVFQEEIRAPVESKADLAANELILWRPPPDDPEGRQIVSVDSKLTKVLREHQRIGVQFMFDCLMGQKEFNGCGCILADDMGLGKTLQSVAIIWTLLTQGGPRGKPACRKALVVCPASLVKNWAGEFDKWLEKGTCKYVACAVVGQAQVSGTFLSFRHSYDAKVLIASYETFRLHAEEVANCGIDLVICDEAHKLKNDEAAVTKCIAGLSSKRRLLISGTPIQNNLDEFFTLVSVANPGVFGDAATFRKTYGRPILRGREPDATAEERQAGVERITAISEITEQFILRRTNKLNARFLPPKQLFNVFVQPTEFQRRLYHCFLRSNVAQKLLGGDGEVKMTRNVLQTIKKLQSLVNHPFLVRSPTEKLEAGFDDQEAQALFAEIDAQDRMGAAAASGPSLRGNGRSQNRPVHEELSGKMLLLHRLLVAIKAAGKGDRIVVISNWTQTLNVIEKMCEHNEWPVHRLDGSMAIAKRMKLVDDFNRPENEKAFVFLLSSKAGGCGLNLIGANRLVMFDPDWNPANDRQAMARIWRDGQKKSCFIYRMFTTGTIDEKVYQRQICKDGLSTMMVTETGDDEKGDMRESLAADLVKDLFTFSEDTVCATHDMLECSRCGTDKGKVIAQADQVVEDDLHTWSHHAGTEGVPDDVLSDAAQRMQRMYLNAKTEAGPLKDAPKVTFTMGCHIVFTPEMIAKLEAEDKEVQRKREERVAAASAIVEDEQAISASSATANQSSAAVPASVMASSAPKANVGPYPLASPAAAAACVHPSLSAPVPNGNLTAPPARKVARKNAPQSVPDQAASISSHTSSSAPPAGNASSSNALGSASGAASLPRKISASTTAPRASAQQSSGAVAGSSRSSATTTASVRNGRNSVITVGEIPKASTAAAAETVRVTPARTKADPASSTSGGNAMVGGNAAELVDQIRAQIAAQAGAKVSATPTCKAVGPAPVAAKPPQRPVADSRNVAQQSQVAQRAQQATPAQHAPPAQHTRSSARLAQPQKLPPNITGPGAVVAVAKSNAVSAAAAAQVRSSPRLMESLVSKADETAVGDDRRKWRRLQQNEKAPIQVKDDDVD